MDRDEAMGILQHMKTRVVTDDLDTTIRVGRENEAIDFAIADMKICAMNNAGWKNAKDNPPENGQQCLTYSPRGRMRVVKAYQTACAPDEVWWEAPRNDHFVSVTHWMELPPPPQKEST